MVPAWTWRTGRAGWRAAWPSFGDHQPLLTAAAPIHFCLPPRAMRKSGGAGISPISVGLGVDLFLGQHPLEEAGDQSQVNKSLALVCKPPFSAQGSVQQHLLYHVLPQAPQLAPPAVFWLGRHLLLRELPMPTSLPRKHRLHGRGWAHLGTWSTLGTRRPWGTRRTLKHSKRTRDWYECSTLSLCCQGGVGSRS